MKVYSKNAKKDHYKKVKGLMKLGGGTDFFLTCAIKKKKKKKLQKSILSFMLLACNPCKYTRTFKNNYNYKYIRNIYT